ncbi:hypothetical protein ACSS6W_007802 [Trichoderma asperelloides]
MLLKGRCTMAYGADTRWNRSVLNPQGASRARKNAPANLIPCQRTKNQDGLCPRQW